MGLELDDFQGRATKLDVVFAFIEVEEDFIVWGDPELMVNIGLVQIFVPILAVCLRIAISMIGSL